MKLTIVFKHEFEVQMKRQFGNSFVNPLVVYGGRKVYMRDGYLHSVIWDDRMWSMSDISQFFHEPEDSDEAEKKEPSPHLHRGHGTDQGQP